MIEREIRTVRLAKAEFSEENRVSTGTVKAKWLGGGPVELSLDVKRRWGVRGLSR